MYSRKNGIKNVKAAMLAAAVLLLCLFTGCGGNEAADTAEEPAVSDGAAENTQYYDMEFHRGGRDARPENTLYSYQYSLENGASTIECDMQMTSDGELVMSHNPVLNPDLTTDPDGNYIEPDTYYIPDMTLEEVRKFNVGRMDPTCEYYEMHGASQVMADTHIPSLRELFELVRDSGNDYIMMNIEAECYPDPAMGIYYEKSPDKDKMLKEFLSLVREFGFEKRVYLQSFDWDALVRMEAMDPEIETVALYSEQPSWGGPDATTLWLDREEPSPWLGGINIHDHDDDPVKAAHSLGLDNVSPYWGEVTAELVEEAHEAGMKVIPWTVNYPEDMETIYNMGVDGMITDRPWVLREFLESKGENLRPASEVSLPYHLDTDHIDTGDAKVENGMDAAH